MQNHCVPRCLEFILNKRILNKREINFGEIVEQLQEDGDGFGVDIESFRKIFGSFGLNCVYQSPYINLETDLILKQINDGKDILVAYDYGKLSGERQPVKHMSVVLGHDLQEDRIYLFDPPDKEFNVCFVRLNNSIRVDEDDRYGFYVIG